MDFREFRFATTTMVNVKKDQKNKKTKKPSSVKLFLPILGDPP